MTQHAFQTEVNQLLQLMIHSLYSEREIFLRELVSNASDACDKLRFLSLTEPQLSAGDSDYKIEIRTDKADGVLVISDNGVGLTEAEAIEHLGTIAKSGTKAFLGKLGDDQKQNAHLIGQFGVGFYAAFMVADKVVVESRSARAGSADGVRWESAGDGNFATETIERAARGTTVTLHLKDDAKEFLDAWRIKALVKKWSDYVTYPISMAKEEGKPELEQVNSGQPLWTKPKDGLKDEDYTQFYRAACRQYDEPATRIHASVEGRLSYTTLLFVPSEKPFDLFERERRGVSLYVRRVFIMDDCKHLLPEWLRFVRGVVDSDDLPLNVSREILQQQATVETLRKQLTKRVVDHLLKLAQSPEEADRKVWATIDTTFGTVIREGIVTDHENKDRAARLARWRSTWTEAEADRGPTGLEEYIKRCPETQKEVYYVTAPNLAAAKANPAIEGFVKAGREVLFLADPVDEFVAQHLTEFDGRKLVDAAKGAADLGDADSKKALAAKAKELEGFLGFAKESLAAGIGDVRLTGRLADSPCCLVAEEHGINPQMEALMRRMGQSVPEQKRILELNPGHPLVARLTALYADEAQRGQVTDALHLLCDQATLAAGGTVGDGAATAKRVQALMAKALG